MDQTIFSFLFDQIGTSVESFVLNASTTMIGIIGTLATILFTIYVLLWGVALASGQVSEPFTDGMKRIVRMAIIIALATTAGVYQDMVVSTFKDGPMEIARELQLGPQATPTDANAMGRLLDETLSAGLQVAAKPWEKGAELNAKNRLTGLSAEGLILQLMAIVLGLIAIIVTCIAAGIVFVAYMALALLLGIGPLFILFAIFPATQRWAEAWLGQVVNYGLLFILISLASALLFHMLTEYFNGLFGSSGGGAGDDVAAAAEAMWIVLKAVGLAIAMTAVLLQVNSIAASLAGGAAIQASNLAGKLAGAGMATAALGRAGMGNARAFIGGARGTELGAGGGGRSARSSREVSHRAGELIRSGAARARQTFSQRNTISGN